MSYVPNIRKPILSGYKIGAYGITMYCKITEYGVNTNNNTITDDYKCTMSFGTGFKKFCLIASYSKQNPYELYIDRVENKDNCIIGGKLSDVIEGTAKLVRLALWTMTIMYPHVMRYTLKDDSHIPCDRENSKDALHLGYDYIIKYNETWYQRKFNAELPGFISKSVNKDTNLVEIHSEEKSLMRSVYESFKALDGNLVPIDLVSDLIPHILHYKGEYKSSNTPREFINKLRTKLGTQYCTMVGRWLANYMFYLKVDIEMNKWYILKDKIIKPPHYTIVRLSPENTKRALDGGRRRTQKRSTSSACQIVSRCNIRN